MATKKEPNQTPEAAQSYVPTKDDKVLPDGSIIIGGNKRIPVYVEELPGVKEQPDVIVSINGRNVQIQRGHTVEVTPEVYEVLQNAKLLRKVRDDYYYQHAQ